MLAGAFWDGYLLDDKKYKGRNTTMGNKVIIDGIIVGYAVALSTYGKFRGAVSPVGQAVKSRREQELERIEEMEEFVKNNIEKTTTAFFDEFIPLTPKMSDDKRYHGFLHFFETVFDFVAIVWLYYAATLQSRTIYFLKISISNSRSIFPTESKILYDL